MLRAHPLNGGMTMTTATDPVCGMTVEVEKSTAPSTLEGKTYHFCGKGCRAKWDVNPQKYVRKTAARESRVRS